MQRQQRGKDKVISRGEERRGEERRGGEEVKRRGEEGMERMIEGLNSGKGRDQQRGRGQESSRAAGRS
eukprot:9839-Hanusia_phi.AAC.1